MNKTHFPARWIGALLLLTLVVLVVACSTPAPTSVPPTAVPPTAVPATKAPASSASSSAASSVAPTSAASSSAASSSAASSSAASKSSAVSSSASSSAASVAADYEFFKGKNITFIVATKPGGGYDTYARTIAPFLQKYIPGSTVVIKNVPGAGHIVGANEVYAAKPDGLTIGTFNTALIYSQIVGAEGIQFDLAKYTWLAKLSSDNRVLMVGAKTPYQTFDDLLKASQTKPIVLSSSGLTSAAHIDALLIQEALGLKVKMISGYQGNDSDLAILRGEVEGGVGSWGSFKHFVDSKDGRVLMQIGLQDDPELKGIPNITSLVKPEKKAISDLIIADASLGRLIAAPPGLPAARSAALIEAMKKAVADPEFLANAKKADLMVDPAWGDAVGKLVAGSLNQSPADLKTLKDVLGPATTGN